MKSYENILKQFGFEFTGERCIYDDYILNLNNEIFLSINCQDNSFTIRHGNKLFLELFEEMSYNVFKEKYNISMLEIILEQLIKNYKIILEEDLIKLNKIIGEVDHD